MALLPVKFYWAFRLDPDEEISFTIENSMETAKAVFNPMLRMYNSSGAVIHEKIEHLLDLGFGDDPLNCGTFTYTLLDEDVPNNSIRDFAPAPQIDLAKFPATRHTVYAKNTDPSLERIVRFILFGEAEVSAQLPADQEIVLISQGWI
jgi:hypothetical protein